MILSNAGAIQVQVELQEVIWPEFRHLELEVWVVSHRFGWHLMTFQVQVELQEVIWPKFRHFELEVWVEVELQLQVVSHRLWWHLMTFQLWLWQILTMRRELKDEES